MSLIAAGVIVVQTELRNRSARWTDGRQCSPVPADWSGSPGETPTRPLSSFDSATGDKWKLFASEKASETGLSYAALMRWPLCSFWDTLLSNHCCIQFNPVPLQFWSESQSCSTVFVLSDTGNIVAWENSFWTHARYDPSTLAWPSTNEFGGGTFSFSQSVLKHQATQM